MLNGFMIIDAHCHIYPEKIAARATLGTDTFYGLHSVCKGTAADLLRRGTKTGIDRFIVQSVATTPEQVQSINRFIAGEVQNANGRLVGLGTLHPAAKNPEDDLKHLLALGLHGVKLHPDIQDFKIDDYRCLKVYELCERYGVPILMHTGDSRFDRSNPNRLLPVMQIYTGLTVVAAHLGGWSVWEQAGEQLCGLPNLFVDCSSSFGFLPVERVKKIILTYGCSRVLFGTDYPMWAPEKELNLFFKMQLTESQNRQILAENAKRAFGL